MRDTNNMNKSLSDRQIFEQFRKKVRELFIENGFELRFSFPDHIAVIYKEGIIEIYVYDRPVNPRFENGIFKFDWFLANEMRTVSIIPV